MLGPIRQFFQEVFYLLGLTFDELFPTDSSKRKQVALFQDTKTLATDLLGDLSNNILNTLMDDEDRYVAHQLVSHTQSLLDDDTNKLSDLYRICFVAGCLNTGFSRDLIYHEGYELIRIKDDVGFTVTVSTNLTSTPNNCHLSLYEACLELLTVMDTFKYTINLESSEWLDYFLFKEESHSWIEGIREERRVQKTI